MSFPDFSGKVVLITGGTRGIGLETGLSFGKRGALCVLTYSWGDHDEQAILNRFKEVGAPTPMLIQADVVNNDDTTALLNKIKERASKVDIFISNVAVAASVRSFDDLSLKGLKQSISYSTWPMVGYTKEIYKVFGVYPKYILGMSSTGPDNYSMGYDYVAASKSLIELFAKYLNYHLRGHDVCVNVVRSRAIKTKSLEDTFGKDLAEFVEKFMPDNFWILPEELSEAIVGLCSGYCDAISGETVTVDKGTTFFDNLMEIYNRSQKNKLKSA
ncbi:SDR family oxidoreductase [Aurantibacillus circumpalustris]|uniref:SDR family oxidoreductase n=1 Tax=Aurantibacillus circumpalustris TaxID=3036359 RepID=UPI00295BEAA4|nr:SDR family oxidoreductase [Aurantibacillus circumpalustris]